MATGHLNPEQTSSVFKIDVNEAAKYTDRWRQMHEDANEKDYVKAITVDAEELKSVIEELGKNSKGKLNAVRFYLGRKPATKMSPSGFQGKDITCLILVGVAGFEENTDLGKPPLQAGVDLTQYFTEGLPGADGLEEPGEVVSGCYDFTYPCPSTCAVGSVLLGE